MLNESLIIENKHLEWTNLIDNLLSYLEWFLPNIAENKIFHTIRSYFYSFEVNTFTCRLTMIFIASKDYL